MSGAGTGSPPSVTPRLSVRGLGVELPHGDGWVRVLDDVNLTVGEAEIVGLVGESGSGKSVTAFSILRLLPPGARVSGQILLGPVDLAREPVEVLRDVRLHQVRMVFQDPQATFDPLIPLGRQLRDSVPPDRRADSEAEIRRSLAELQIDDVTGLLSARPHQVSGGQLQRAAFASALLASPRILLCDEPTTALDATTEAQILGILRRVRDQHGTGILLTSHDIGLIEALADSVVVMYAGRVVESGPARQVLSAPAHPYTAALIASQPSPRARRGQRLVAVEGRAPEAGRLPSGCAFHPRCPLADERCRTLRPEFADVGAGRGAACWKAPDGARQLAGSQP